MKSARQYPQVGFQKKPKPNKENIADSINRIISKQNHPGFLNTTQTDYLLSSETHHKHRKERSSRNTKVSGGEGKRESLRQKPPLRKRIQSFQEISIRMNSRSLMNNISHRSGSKSKIDERLDEMLINQKVKEEMMSQNKSRQNSLGKPPPRQTKNQLNLNKSVRQATLSKYINELTEEGKSEKRDRMEERSEEYVINQLSTIISLIDGIFGVSRSQKLVSSYREEKCLSIPSLISTIKMKLESAAKDSKIKP